MEMYVTVGSTSFDLLIKTMTSQHILDILVEKGYRRLLLQMGRGDLSVAKNEKIGEIEVSTYQFKPSIQEDMKKADLIISHAGAGSILESLRKNKPVIVVVNEDLMDNHQLEVAKKLREEGYLAYATCKTLAQVLKTLDVKSFKPFPQPNPQIFQRILDAEMGLIK